MDWLGLSWRAWRAPLIAGAFVALAGCMEAPVGDCVADECFAPPPGAKADGARGMNWDAAVEFSDMPAFLLHVERAFTIDQDEGGMAASQALEGGRAATERGASDPSAFRCRFTAWRPVEVLPSGPYRLRSATVGEDERTGDTEVTFQVAEQRGGIFGMRCDRTPVEPGFHVPPTYREIREALVAESDPWFRIEEVDRSARELWSTAPANYEEALHDCVAAEYRVPSAEEIVALRAWVARKAPANASCVWSRAGLAPEARDLRTGEALAIDRSARQCHSLCVPGLLTTIDWREHRAVLDGVLRTGAYVHDSFDLGGAEYIAREAELAERGLTTVVSAARADSFEEVDGKVAIVTRLDATYATEDGASCAALHLWRAAGEDDRVEVTSDVETCTP